MKAASDLFDFLNSFVIKKLFSISPEVPISPTTDDFHHKLSFSYFHTQCALLNICVFLWRRERFFSFCALLSYRFLRLFFCFSLF